MEEKIENAKKQADEIRSNGYTASVYIAKRVGGRVQRVWVRCTDHENGKIFQDDDGHKYRMELVY